MKKELPSSAACVRNTEPIDQVLKQYIQKGDLWEMGFATAQHCQSLAPRYPNLTWYASDHTDYHWIFTERTRGIKNIQGPYCLWVKDQSFLNQLHQQNIQIQFDYFFTANTLHIMGAELAQIFCQQVATILKKDGVLFLYGPFKFEGQFTSASNADFDQQLRSKNPKSGICHFEDIARELKKAKVDFVHRHDLPAYNHVLVFKKA